MSIVQTGNAVHDKNVQISEAARQTAVAAAGSNMALVLAAEITHERTCLASAKANGINGSQHIYALKELGVGV
jgi:hypothetical protein